MRFWFLAGNSSRAKAPSLVERLRAWLKPWSTLEQYPARAEALLHPGAGSSPKPLPPRALRDGDDHPFKLSRRLGSVFRL